MKVDGESGLLAYFLDVTQQLNVNVKAKRINKLYAPSLFRLHTIQLTMNV